MSRMAHSLNPCRASGASLAMRINPVKCVAARREGEPEGHGSNPGTGSNFSWENEIQASLISLPSQARLLPQLPISGERYRCKSGRGLPFPAWCKSSTVETLAKIRTKCHRLEAKMSIVPVIFEKKGIEFPRVANIQRVLFLLSGRVARTAAVTPGALFFISPKPKPGSASNGEGLSERERVIPGRVVSAARVGLNVCREAEVATLA